MSATARHPHYKIVPGRSGSFLCPPGHPHHSWSLEGYESTRHRNAFFIGALSSALKEDFDGIDAIKARVRKIFDDAVMVESELWVRSVYRYFRTIYIPADGSRDVSTLTEHSPAHIAVNRTAARLAQAFKDITTPDANFPNPQNYRRGVTAVTGRRRGYEITAAPDGTKVYVYALDDDGSRYDAAHLFQYATALWSSEHFTDVEHQPMCDEHAGRIVATLTDPAPFMDPKRHAAVACIREYFPGHTPRLDLILNPDTGHNDGVCLTCGQHVQYEAEFDALAVVTTRLDGNGVTQWTYITTCANGAPHTTEAATDTI